jgi:hypothetical protein
MIIGISEYAQHYLLTKKIVQNYVTKCTVFMYVLHYWNAPIHGLVCGSNSVRNTIIIATIL